MLSRLIGSLAMLMLYTGCMAQAAPLARFEHVFTVLDADTAKAVAKSAYLRDFSGLEEKTTRADEGNYHGIYIWGRENYVELFGPADFNLDGPPAAVGMLGIGLNVGRVGGLEQIKPRVEKSGLSVEIRTFHKSLGGRTVDWFRGLGTPASLDEGPAKSAIPGVEIFVVEFIPSYLDVPEANKAPSLGPGDIISLARYHRRDYKARMLQNITAVKLAITPEDWPELRAMLAGAGYRITETATGARTVGDVIATFVFVPRQQVGLRQIDFSLNSKPGTRHVEILGRSRLVVGPGAAAVWTFDQRP